MVGNWGIFGSLKSTETINPSGADELKRPLRNFRLAEEHWNMELWFTGKREDGIEEFSARWRALKRNIRNVSCCTCSLIEEFSARWRALKLPAEILTPHFPNRLRNFRLAEEHWNIWDTYSDRLLAYYWGIFGSLKSTETPYSSRFVNSVFHWGIFGSLKSTETSTGEIPLQPAWDWGIFGSLKSTETFEQNKTVY